MRRAQGLSNQPASYYDGPLTVGPLDSETAAFGSRANYNNSVFAPGSSPKFSHVTGALQDQLGGNTGIGAMSSAISPFSTQALTQQFAAPNTQGIAGLQAPGGTNSAGQIGTYGFGTSLDPSGRAPTFGVAGGLDARPAYERALSGTPDYEGVKGAIEAANAPLLRQFNEEFIPGLNQRATFTNNMTGGIKGMNRAIPELADRMSENALSITNNERLRALDSQERAANAVASGGFQGYGLGLSTAQGERGLEQSLANLGLSADSTRAGLINSDFGNAMAGANFGLNREGMLQDVTGRYRSDLLGLGQLGAGIAGQAGSQQLSAIGQFPSIYNVGRQPGDDALEFANYDRALREDALAADRERFDYLRDAPYNQLGWYQNILSGASAPYGTQTGSQSGSRTAGVLGGAMSGASMGSAFGPWGTLIGGGLGGLLGAF